MLQAPSLSRQNRFLYTRFLLVFNQDMENVLNFDQSSKRGNIPTVFWCIDLSYTEKIVKVVSWHQS